jgi:cell wall-associated NlpC family hydrolase
MITRAEFVATVRGYIDTPYHHQGRLPGLGLDCPGPLICACWHLGIKPRSFDVQGYGRSPDGHTLQRLCEEHMQRIREDEASAGDVLLIRFGQGMPQHLGILTDANPLRRYWVEAEGYRHRRVLESRLLFNRATALVAAYRVPGLA